MQYRLEPTPTRISSQALDGCPRLSLLCVTMPPRRHTTSKKRPGSAGALSSFHLYLNFSSSCGNTVMAYCTETPPKKKKQSSVLVSFCYYQKPRSKFKRPVIALPNQVLFAPRVADHGILMPPPPPLMCSDRMCRPAAVLHSPIASMVAETSKVTARHGGSRIRLACLYQTSMLPGQRPGAEQRCLT
jgi:hypothetical protein